MKAMKYKACVNKAEKILVFGFVFAVLAHN